MLSIDKQNIEKKFKTIKNTFMKLEKNMFTNLNKTEVNELTKEVKETIALDYQAQAPKAAFCVADLWNIQKMKKVRAYRREIIG